MFKPLFFNSFCIFNFLYPSVSLLFGLQQHDLQCAALHECKAPKLFGVCRSCKAIFHRTECCTRRWVSGTTLQNSDEKAKSVWANDENSLKWHRQARKSHKTHIKCQRTPQPAILIDLLEPALVGQTYKMGYYFILLVLYFRGLICRVYLWLFLMPVQNWFLDKPLLSTSSRLLNILTSLHTTITLESRV